MTKLEGNQICNLEIKLQQSPFGETTKKSIPKNGLLKRMVSQKGEMQWLNAALVWGSTNCYLECSLLVAFHMKSCC